MAGGKRKVEMVALIYMNGWRKEKVEMAALIYMNGWRKEEGRDGSSDIHEWLEERGR